MKRCGDCEFFSDCRKICKELSADESFPEVGGCPLYHASDKAVIKIIAKGIETQVHKHDTD